MTGHTHAVKVPNVKVPLALGTFSGGKSPAIPPKVRAL